MAAIKGASPISPVVNRVSEEEYMEKYAANFYELVDGGLVSLMPVMGIHDKLVRFLSNWFEAYLETHPIVELREAPFVMRLKTHREPDLQIILHQHLDHLTETYTDGAADLVVEVVSEESIKRDYEDKFKEYAAGGVREYWIIDPLKQEAHFYVLNAEGHYQRVMPDANNSYALSVLPELRLPINLLWTNPLPGPRAIARFLDSSDQ